LLEKGNTYREKVSVEELDKVASEVIKEEFFKSWLALILEENPMSVREMATITGLNLEMISSSLTELEDSGKIYLHSFEGRAAKYAKSR